MGAPKYDVAISGMGPAALATAWELATHTDKKILIVSDRPNDFLRVQGIFIHPQIRDYLCNMYDPQKSSPINLEDEKVLNAIKHDLTVSIKDIERYIMRRLNEVIQNGSTIDFEFNSEFDEIDLNNGVGKIRNKRDKEGIKNKEVTFDDFVDADGSHHHALNLVQMKFSTPEITHAAIENQVLPYHIGAYISIKRKDGRELILPERDVLCFVHENLFVMMRLHKESNGFSQTKNQIKCSILSEIPKDIWDLPNQEQRKEQGFKALQEVIQTYLTKLGNGELEVALTKPSKKHGEAKDRLKLLVFSENEIRANKACIQMGEKYFFLIGDALNTTNYRFASGLNYALALAPELRDAIMTKNVDAYEKNNRLRMEKYDSYRNFTNLFASTKEAEARFTEELFDSVRIRLQPSS